MPDSAVGVVSYDGERCTATCRVVDVSAGGCRLELDLEDWVNPVASARGLPATFKLVVQALAFEADCAVAWRDKTTVGVRFVGRVRQLPREFRKRRAFNTR